MLHCVPTGNFFWVLPRYVQLVKYRFRYRGALRVYNTHHITYTCKIIYYNFQIIYLSRDNKYHSYISLRVQCVVNYIHFTHDML